MSSTKSITARQSASLKGYSVCQCHARLLRTEKLQESTVGGHDEKTKVENLIQQTKSIGFFNCLKFRILMVIFEF